jgi:phage gp46-like protein
MSTDRYSGDPRIILTANGADLDYRGGQPVMDRGLENCILISLFTREGWAGNAFLPTERRMGSDYEKTCRGAITLSKLADVENSAERALSSKAFGTVKAEASNPTADHLNVEVSVGSGGALSLTRERSLWAAQISDPASRRLS